MTEGSAGGRATSESVIRIETPFSDDDISLLRAGDRVLLSGVLFTARDAAHKRFDAALNRGEPVPIDLRGQAVYYVGPTPPRPGQVIGAAGPTTAGRMDPYTPRLLSLGLKAVIGKGRRSSAVREALVTNRAVYLGAVGGLGALLSKRIVKAEVVAYPDLGAEAVFRLEVRDFPLLVLNDAYGGDVYDNAPNRWKKMKT